MCKTTVVGSTPPSRPRDRQRLTQSCLQAIETNVISLLAPERRGEGVTVATLRTGPVVAADLVLSAAVWTNDGDFLGTGVASWTTDTLQRWLDRQPAPGD